MTIKSADKQNSIIRSSIGGIGVGNMPLSVKNSNNSLSKGDILN